MKHRLPLECIGDFEPISDEIHQEIQRLITSIGLDNSPFVVDLIADEQCSYTKAFLEINPRPGGITPSIYDMTHGTDLI
jgi:D-alanine-D-alanine ligase-like ATP-grasp enzyme